MTSSLADLMVQVTDMIVKYFYELDETINTCPWFWAYYKESNY